MLATIPSLRAVAMSLSGNVERADDLEPGQTRPQPALKAALHRCRQPVRTGLHDACRSGGGRTGWTGAGGCPDTSNAMILVPFLNPKFCKRTCRTMCANFGFAAP